MFVLLFFFYIFVFFFFFFFFQAEDGIRDPLVTGVQTCALPIYAEPAGVLDSGLGGQQAHDFPDGQRLPSVASWIVATFASEGTTPESPSMRTLTSSRSSPRRLTSCPSRTSSPTASPMPGGGRSASTSR